MTPYKILEAALKRLAEELSRWKPGASNPSPRHTARMSGTPRDRRYAVPPRHEELEPIYAALDMEPAWVGRRFGRNQPNPVPRLLFKYRSIRPSERCDESECRASSSAASYASVEKARDIIVRSSLWLSSPADFNDPFDASAHLVAQGNADARKARFVQMVKNAQPGFNRQQRKAKVAELMQRTTGDLVATFKQSMENMRHTMGVCSFAGSARSILMWSHYAADHAGVCLVFAPMRDYRAFSHALTVTYSDDYPRVNLLQKLEDSLVNVLTAKANHWKYEAERRIMLEGQAHTYLRFDSRALVGVVTGCRAPPFVLDTVAKLMAERKAAGLPQIKHYVASQHPKRYQLVLKRAAA